MGCTIPGLPATSRLDMIAEELGIDPVEIRLRNAIKNPKPGKIYETINKLHVATCGVEECIEKAAEADQLEGEEEEEKDVKVIRLMA